MVSIKRFIILLAISLITIGFKYNIDSLAYDQTIPISIKVNNQLIVTTQNPYISNGTMFVPIRNIAAAINVEQIHWNNNHKTAVLIYKDRKIELPIGSSNIIVNGIRKPINGRIEVLRGCTYVPLRLISEILDCQVTWDNTTYTALIRKDGISIPNYIKLNRGYTDDDIVWLAKIVRAESNSEPLEGQVAVANVILNRKKSPEYPNTVYGVIFDNRYGTVQFQPVANGTIYKNPTNYNVIAAKKALDGYNNIGQCKFFLNPRIATSNWIARNRVFYKRINRHDFYI